MKRWGKLKPVHFDRKELNTDLGTGNFIFVGSSCDMWADAIPDEWIEKTLVHCQNFDDKYLFQTKNPKRLLDYIYTSVINNKCVVCTTIESNRDYREIMNNAPSIKYRIGAMQQLSEIIDTYITIEPILDFDLDELVDWIWECDPRLVSIGADSKGHNLSEPNAKKVLQLIAELKKFTTVYEKPNLKRLLKGTCK
jgi:DNA repair photolyase